MRIYDHRNFGASGGEPRQDINPWIQCRGYRDAITFVETLDGVDAGRIGLWGDSYSGGQVLAVGAVDDRLHADYAVARLVYDLMPEPKEWYDIEGGHFGLLYYPSDLFDEATGVQSDFFRRCFHGEVGTEPAP